MKIRWLRRAVGVIGLLFWTAQAMMPSAGRCQPPQKPSKPTVPAAILAEARRAFLISGRTITRPPDEYEFAQRYDGRGLWFLKWNKGHDFDFTVTVEHETNRAISFHDYDIGHELKPEYKKQTPIKTTRMEARALCETLAAQLRLSPGDWSAVLPKLAMHGSYDGTGFGDMTYTGNGEAYWDVSKELTVHGLKVGYFSVRIEPYHGRICDWSFDDADGQIFLIPGGSLLPEAETRQIATRTMRVFAASIIRPTDRIAPTVADSHRRIISPAWRTVVRGLPFQRLYYVYLFELPEIPDPEYEKNPNQDEAEWHGRWKAQIQITVDAETGEIWEAVNNPSGSSGIVGVFTLDYSVVSLRKGVLSLLSRDKSLALLTGVFASGGVLISETVPGDQMRRFTLSVPTGTLPEDTTRNTEEREKEYAAKFPARTLEFAFDKATRRVYWTTEAGKWSGLQMTNAQTKSLFDWLQQRTGSGLGAGKIK